MRYSCLILSGLIISVILTSCDKSNTKTQSDTKSEAINKSVLSVKETLPNYNNAVTEKNGSGLRHYSGNLLREIALDTNKITHEKIDALGSYPAGFKTVTQNNHPVKDPSFFRTAIVRNPVLGSFIWPYSKLSIIVDNDLFCNTDRYYTNGVSIKWQSPTFAFWPINSFFPLNQADCMEYNSLELHHGMYTPFTTKVPPLLKNDRPYASTLFVRFERRTDNPLKRLSQTASLDIGMIGEAAMGSLLQKGVHAGLPTNDEPLGWETQIANDLILNYNYQVTKLLNPINGVFHTYYTGGASLGTHNTSATAGIGFKIINSGYFMAPLPGKLDELTQTVSSKWLITLDAKFSSSIVGYNSTLNGGVLNNHSIYVLKPEEIERLLLNAELKFEATYGKYGITLAQYYISKEFNEGKSHFWGQIGLNIGF